MKKIMTKTDMKGIHGGGRLKQRIAEHLRASRAVVSMSTAGVAVVVSGVGAVAPTSGGFIGVCSGGRVNSLLSGGISGGLPNGGVRILWHTQ
jgi:hypothetical protein